MKLGSFDFEGSSASAGLEVKAVAMAENRLLEEMLACLSRESFEDLAAKQNILLLPYPSLEMIP